MERCVQLKFLLYNGYKVVGGHGELNWRLDCVLAVAQKLLDLQVLFCSFEKQLDLPTALVPTGNGQVQQGRVVAQEDQSLLGFGLFEADTAQVFGIVSGPIVPVERN